MFVFAECYHNTDPTLDASVLHETACIVNSLQSSRASLFLPLWASSSGLGFQPATISAANYLMVRGQLDGNEPAFAKLKNDFRAILRAGKDPNAITVEGIRLCRLKKLSQASVLLEQALRLGSDFSLFPSCHFHLARIAILQDKPDVAMKHLEFSMQDLRPVTEFELGNLYGLADRLQEAEQHFYNAGMLGVAPAWQRLAELDLGRSLDPKIGARKQHYQIRAAEWTKLNNFFGKSAKSR